MKDDWLAESPDTSAVILTDELNRIADRLAVYTHTVWARERVRTGWSYGPERSDAKKQTPLLVPYESLPEEEKFYDRKIVEEIIKGLLASGYEIRPVSEP